MRKLVLLLIAFVIFPLVTTLAQPVEDYILEHRGDTLVVADDFEAGAPNSLYLLLQSDTSNASYTVPAGRVYMLHKSGYYSLVNGPTTPSDREVVIVGEDSSPIKTNQAWDYPPVICGAAYDGENYGGGMTSSMSLVVKNCNIELGSANRGTISWNWFGYSANARVTVDNCIMEHTYWVMFNLGTNSKTYIKNSYFVNMSGQACRRNGGVIDYFNPIDTIFVENCTHLVAQGSIYKFRSNFTNVAIYNHNTFLDLAGYVFMNVGYQKYMSVTNNIFMNCNVQAWSGNTSFDPGEIDVNALPMGLINVAPEDSIGCAATDLHFYVDNNLVYWDETLTNATDGVVATINANNMSNINTWQSQMITMNSRTQSMFDDDAKYPYLTEGTWIKDVMPNFTNPEDLLTTQLEAIKAYAIDKADTGSTLILADWRLVNPGLDNFTYADWPIPVDLSYDNAELLTAGLGGFPVGDLNWFPTQNAEWLAQREQEYTDITAALNGTVGIADGSELPNDFKLLQNYPNPFNPTTVISYIIPEASNVTLKVYDVLGREVATLVNQFQNANSYQVNFDASSLSSGVYMYTIEAGNFKMTKKMLLLQ